MVHTKSFDKLASEIWEDEDTVFDAKAQDVAIALASAVQRSGFNRAQLAEKLGWKPSRISRVLTGSTNLTLKTIFQICDAIGLEFDVVLRAPYEKVLTVDDTFQHAYLRQARDNLDTSNYLLDTATALNRRTWERARKVQRFTHQVSTSTMAAG